MWGIGVERKSGVDDDNEGMVRGIEGALGQGLRSVRGGVLRIGELED